MIVRELVNRVSFKVDRKSLGNAENRIRKFSRAMKIAIGGITAGLFAVGVAAAKTAGDMETLQTQFEVMLGSAEKANNMIQSLREFSVKTPFELQDLAKASTTLLQFGVSSSKILPTLQMLGDVAGADRQRFSQLALVFGQIQSTGRLMGQDLLQLINAGFNPLQVIAQKTGKSVAVLKDEMSKGKISAEQVAEAFKIATSEGGMFFGNLQKQSLTLKGLFSTMVGAVKDVLISIGQGLLPVIKTATNLMIDLAKGPLMNLAQGLTQALIPVFEAIGKMLPSIIKSIIPLMSLVAELLGQLLPGLLMIVDIAREIIGRVVPPLIQFFSMVAGFFAQLVEKLLPSILPLVGMIGDLLSKILPILSSIIQSALPVFISVLEIVIKLIAQILSFLSPILDLLMPIFNLLSPIFKLLEPIFGIISELMPLLSIILELLKPIVQLTAFLLNIIVKAITPVVNLIGFAIKGFKLWLVLAKALFKIYLGFGTIIARNLIKPFKSFFRLISGIASTIKRSVVDPIDGFISKLFGLRKGIGGLFKDIGEKLLNIFPNLISNVTKIFRDSWNWLAQQINMAIESFNRLTPGTRFDIASRLPMLAEKGLQRQVGGTQVSTINAPMRAKIDVNVTGPAAKDPKGIGMAVAGESQKVFSLELKRLMIAAVS